MPVMETRIAQLGQNVLKLNIEISAKEGKAAFCINDEARPVGPTLTFDFEKELGTLVYLRETLERHKKYLLKAIKQRGKKLPEKGEEKLFAEILEQVV